MKKKTKKRNPNDLTLRNLRALRKLTLENKEVLSFLKFRIELLEAEVKKQRKGK